MMKMMKKTGFYIRYVLAAGLVFVLAGCASTSEIQSLRAMTEEAMAISTGAKDQADAAMGAAQEANANAQRAMDRADAAMQAADEAQTCCEANTRRIDRLLERSMSK
jgi:hypothetical protein